MWYCSDENKLFPGGVSVLVPSQRFPAHMLCFVSVGDMSASMADRCIQTVWKRKQAGDAEDPNRQAGSKLFSCPNAIKAPFMA